MMETMSKPDYNPDLSAEEIRVIGHFVEVFSIFFVEVFARKLLVAEPLQSGCISSVL
jgi:hypothetical protein